MLEERTAGRVADKLLSLTLRAKPEHPERIAAARRFLALVRSRNNLLHSKPGSGVDGGACLMRDGDGWSIREIEGIAIAFNDCAADLSA